MDQADAPSSATDQWPNSNVFFSSFSTGSRVGQPCLDTLGTFPTKTTINGLWTFVINGKIR